MSDFSVGKAAFAGFGLMARNPVSTLVWFAMMVTSLFGYMALGTYLAGDAYAAMAEITRAANENGTPPNMTSLMAAAQQTSLHGLVGGLFRFLFSIIVTAAVLRAALRPANPGLAYMRLGTDELKLFVVMLVVIIITSLAAAVPFVVAIIAAAVTAFSGGPRFLALGIFGVGGLIALCAFAFFTVKFLLATSITIGERRLSIFESWGYAKGRFWKILAALLITVVVLLPIGALTIGGAIFAALQTGEITELSDAQFFISYPPATLGELFLPARLAFFGLMSAFVTIALALFCAMPASIYQQLAGFEDPATADDTDDEDWDDED